MTLVREFIITGTSRGLGMAFFDLLIDAGLRPISIGRSLASQHDRANRSGRCRFIKADLSCSGDVGAINFERVLVTPSDQIVFINNAGTLAPLGTISILGHDALMSALVVNAVAPAIIAAKLLAAADVRQARLRIINITTGAAYRPPPGLGAYAASKAAGMVLFDSLAAERSEVVIDHIDPGIIDTDMQASLRDAPGAVFPAQSTFQRWADEGKLQNARDVAKRIFRDQNLL